MVISSGPQRAFVVLATVVAASVQALSVAPAPSARAAITGDKDAALAAAWLDLRRNEASHDREVSQSSELGYTQASTLPPMETLPSATAYGVPSAATGMGSACPFLTAAIGEQPPPPRQLELPLVFCTDGPLVTAEECASIVHETSQHIAGGGSSSGFTLADTNRNIAVADLPGTQSWLNEVGLPRVAAMMGKCFGEAAIGDPRELFVYRALVVQYDAAAGLTHQEVHRDGSLVTCVVTLNQREEYTGGGTYIEALDRAFAPDMGCGVLQASALRHAGHTIDSGERWVLVLFISAARMKYGEHVRHLKARAQRLSEEGDVEGEVRCLTLARTLCDDADHELLYDQAVGEHERGNLDAAVALYERAYAINPSDQRVVKNMAAARKAMGQ